MIDFSLRLKADPDYPKLIKALRESRPSIPPYQPEKENTERWKAASLRQQGFDAVLTILNINVEDLS